MARARIRWDEIGAATGRVPARLAESLRRGVCQFRQANPYLFDALPNINPLAGPFAFNRAFWNEICNPEPPPGNYPQSITGGLCPTSYRWEVDWATPSVEGTAVDPFNSTYQGPITNPRIKFSRINNGLQVRVDFFFTPFGQTEKEFFIINGDPDASPFVRAVRFIRVDGQPDNCGTRPVERNTVRPVTNNFNTNIEIGGSTFNTNIELGDITTIGDDVISFSPTFNSEFGPFSIGIEGIDIDFGPETVVNEGSDGGSTDLTPVINAVDQTRLQLSTEISEVITDIENLSNLLESEVEDIEDLIRCFCGEEGATYTTETVATETTGGVFNLPADTVCCVIYGTPSGNARVRVQGGGGSSPDVYFWGHIAVCYGGSDGGTRIPLQFERQAVACEERATGIVVSPYYGLVCDVVAIRKGFNCNVNG